MIGFLDGKFSGNGDVREISDEYIDTITTGDPLAHGTAGEIYAILIVLGRVGSRDDLRPGSNAGNRDCD